ncbi:MAG: DUF1405 domain-containing protein [Candidatus Micrarchaeia archaeon]
MDIKDPGMARKILFIILAVAIAFGFYFYSPFFQYRNPLLWIFLPNSPLAILAALLTIYYFTDNEFARLFSSAYVAKYGIWTVFVMLLYPANYLNSSIAAESVLLYIIPHIAMIFLALAMMPRKPARAHLAIALLFFLANDFANYFMGVMTDFPSIIPLGHIDLVRSVSIFLSITLCFFYFSIGPVLSRSRAARAVEKGLGLGKKLKQGVKQ